LTAIVLSTVAFAQTKPSTTSSSKGAPAAATPTASDKKPADAPAAAPAADGKDGAASRPSVGTVTTGWSVGCASAAEAGKLRCEVTNAVILTPVNQRFVALAVRKDMTTSEEVMVASLPHGVLFSSGILAQVDGKESGRFEPLTSDQQGAYAKLPLTAETIDTLGKGKELTVVFDGTGGQKFKVGIPLAGFSTAHDKAKAEN
jgi:invasion protein IalB